MTHDPTRDLARSSMSPRDLNRLAVVELVFREPGVVRSAAQTKTGLSKATIYRIVDDLTREGYLVESPVAGHRARGRPKLELSVSPTQGHVIGIDIGVLTTRLMLSDLNAHVLARRRDTTPRDLSPNRLADWVSERVRELGNEACDLGPLRRVVISLPAKIETDGSITRPAGHLSYLAGSQLLELISQRLKAPTDLRSDPDMALLGEMRIGRAVGYRDVVMFVISSSLSASVAIDGVILGGRRHVIGEFGALRLGDGRVLMDVLTVPGILARAQSEGVVASNLTEFLDQAPPSLVSAVHDDVRAALVAAFSAITLSVDPELIVVTGSLLPVISSVLAATEADLTRELPGVPAIALSETGGFSQPRGAVEVALNHVRREMLEAVASGST